MSQSNSSGEADGNVPEPLLPVEKKLIGWSLGLGIVLLIVLLVLNHAFPAQV